MEEMLSQCSRALIWISICQCIIIVLACVAGIKVLNNKINSPGHSYFGNKDPKTKRLMCVMSPRNDEASWFEVGKTYELKNGKVIDEQGYVRDTPDTAYVVWVAGYKFYVLD